MSPLTVTGKTVEQHFGVISLTLYIQDVDIATLAKQRATLEHISTLEHSSCPHLTVAPELKMQAQIYLDLLAVLAASSHNVAAINFIEGKGCGTIKKAIRIVDELSKVEYGDAECVIVSDAASYGMYNMYKASLSSKSTFLLHLKVQFVNCHVESKHTRTMVTQLQDNQFRVLNL